MRLVQRGHSLQVTIKTNLLQSLSTKHRTKYLTHQTGNYPVTCFVSRPSGITLVKFHSLQVTIKTNLLAELKHQMKVIIVSFWIFCCCFGPPARREHSKKTKCRLFVVSPRYWHKCLKCPYIMHQTEWNLTGLYGRK